MAFPIPQKVDAYETRFAVLLFTDIVGSSELKTLHGVPAYREALRVHNCHFEGLAARSPGIRILHNMGDGYFAEACGVVEAVSFALLFQEAMRVGPWGEVTLETRVGIHAGEIAVLDSEGGSGIVSPAADLTARIMSLALGGQILFTRLPFDEARPFLRKHPEVAGQTMPPLRWLAHGSYLIKGREDPVEVFEVGAEGLAPLVPPPDSEKAKRAIRPGDEETLGWRPALGLEIPGRPGWQLVGRLGEGGFGEVWAGEHPKLGQTRAFKFCFDEERLRALKREMTLVRLLRNALGLREDIVRIREIKLDKAPFYIESDLAPHGNLLQWAEQQGGLEKIPLAQRISLVAHTATALSAAHSLGVLHKDIKPTNILIFDGPGGEPRPRLVDFGIGTLAEPGVLANYGVTAAGFTRVTMQHSTGTPTYSPPEYLAGRPYTIQGDIFGLGVLLYQLVTAKPLDPLAPGWERDVADPLLREDIALCVDGDPTRRLTSAAELAERLNTLEQRRAEIEEKASLARAESARIEAEATAAAAQRRAAQLRRLVVAFASLALLAIIGGALAWNYQRAAAAAQRLAEGERSHAEEAKSRALEAEAQALAQRDRANELLDFQAYSHALERGDLAMAFDRLGHAYRRNPRWEYGLGFGRIAAGARASFVPVQRIACEGDPILAVFCWWGLPSSPHGFDLFAKARHLMSETPSSPNGVESGELGRSLLVVAFKDSVQAFDLANAAKVATYAFEQGQEPTSLHEVRSLGEGRSSGVVIAFQQRPPLVLSLPDLKRVCDGPANLAGANVAACRGAPVVAAFRGRTMALFDPGTGRELARKTFATSVVDRIAKVSFPPNGRSVGFTSFRLGPLVLWDWRQDTVTFEERMQSFDFPCDDSRIGSFSKQLGGDLFEVLVRDRRASGNCKLPLPRVHNIALAARRIYEGESPAENFLLVTHDESAAEFFHLAGTAAGSEWKGAVVERSVVTASALDPHVTPHLPVRLLTVDPETQQLAVQCGETVEIYAPRGALYGEMGVGVDTTSYRPSEGTQGGSAADLPCEFWAACPDGDDFWSAIRPGKSGANVSKFAFAQDRWRMAREDYTLLPPEDLAVVEGKQLVIAAIAKDPRQNSVFVLWEMLTTTLHTDQSASLDLMVARYDLPVDGKPASVSAQLAPALRFRLSEHPREGVRRLRGFQLDNSGEVLVCATEKVAAGYSTRDGGLLYRLPAANRFAFSSDGRHIALGNWKEGRKVEVRDCQTGRLVMETTQSESIRSVAFSPDGTRLAVGWERGKMEIFEVGTGTRVQELNTALAPVLLLPGGDRFVGLRVADGGVMGEVFLADSTDGQPIHLLGASNFLNRWYVNPSGDLIAQVLKYSVPLFRRSTPEQVEDWLGALWPGGVVPRPSVLGGGPTGQGLSRVGIIENDLGAYRAAPRAPSR